MFITATWGLLRIGGRSYSQEGLSRFPFESYSYGNAQCSLGSCLNAHRDESIFPYKVDYLPAVNYTSGLFRLDMPMPLLAVQTCDSLAGPLHLLSSGNIQAAPGIFEC
jgi:hypothetical protein